MKNMISHIALALLLLAGAAGCRSTDESQDKARAKYHNASAMVLTAAQIRSATDQVIKEILNSPQFRSCIESHKKAEGKLPLMVIELMQNNTDRHLDGETVNIRIADALFNAGLVRISDRNARRVAATGRSRNLGNPDTAEEKSLIEAPQLLMSSRIALQKDRLGSKKEISAVLSVQITELKSGENVMRTSVVWGAEKRRSFLGL